MKQAIALAIAALCLTLAGSANADLPNVDPHKVVQITCTVTSHLQILDTGNHTTDYGNQHVCMTCPAILGPAES